MHPFIYYFLLTCSLLLIGSNSPVSAQENKELTITPTTNKTIPRIKYHPFIIPEGYNRLEIPSEQYVYASVVGFDKPAEFGPAIPHNVSVTFVVVDINDLNEIEEDITFSVNFILGWVDYVIAKDGQAKFDLPAEKFIPGNADIYFKTLDLNFLPKLWKPDIYVDDVIRIIHPEVMSPAITFRVNAVTGEVVYMSRLRLQLQCQMDFHYYPADTQGCHILLHSNAYSFKSINLDWTEPFGASLGDCNDANFEFQISDLLDENTSEAYIGAKRRTFSTLGFTIKARRKLSYHMFQTYLPSAFFIVITWLCFLVPARMVEARIGISMTTLLTLTAMFASVRESSPTVSYVRAIDIWMISCIFSVFLTLLEFTALVWLRDKDEDKKEGSSGNEAEAEEEEAFNKKPFTVGYKPSSSSNLKRSTAERDRKLKTQISNFIEKYAFIMFSVLFIVFSCVYWSWLLIGSGYFDWEVNPKHNMCNGD